MTFGRSTLWLVLVPMLAAGCQWREGSVYVHLYDGSPDGGDADAGGTGDADQECTETQVEWLDPGSVASVIGAPDLEVTVLDTRPLERCNTARLPGALCTPWDGEELVGLPTIEDEPGWLVLYDENAEVLPAVFETLPLLCEREVAALDDGFGAWVALGLELE